MKQVQNLRKIDNRFNIKRKREINKYILISLFLYALNKKYPESNDANKK